jgi:drug/metabolite transporter (DMT)-like permease
MLLRVYLQIVVIIAMLCAGQLIFRESALSVPPLNAVSGLQSLARNPVFLVALALYGLSTMLWVGVLQQAPLSRAYPFMALSFAVVPLASALTTSQTPSVRLGLGVCLVVGGLILIGGRA